MAADAGILLRMDVSEITADKIASVVRRVIQVLEYRTLTLAFNASYSLGTTTADNTIDVGTVSSVDFGVFVLMDSTLSEDIKADILQRVLQAISAETVTANARLATFAEGNGTFQVEINVT